MKRLWMGGIILIVLLSALGCREQKVYYFKAYGKSYGSTGKSATIVTYPDSWFKRRGYVQIGRIGVMQVQAICYSSCKKYSYNKTLYQYLVSESSKRGAHMVQMVTRATTKKIPISRNTMQCEKWGKKRVRVAHTTCKGGEVGSNTVRDCTTRYTYEYKKTCVKYKKEKGNKYVLWSRADLWRKVR